MSRLEALAINGGEPVRSALLPYGHQMVSEEDISAVADVLRSDWITTGPKVAEFEEALASYVGADHAVCFSSGTAALHAAAFASGLGPGDEAVTTPMTFCATANCVLYQGATPVFADVSPDTLNVDAEGLEACLTPRSKALIPVDYAGHPAELGAIADLAHDHHLTLIEDACHALGARYGRRAVGEISDMTVFSFHPVKHITTGEGGMVTTCDAGFARRLRLFRNHGIEGDARQRQSKGQWHYEMVSLGYNYRLPDINCALGLSQLKRLDENVLRRRQIASMYSSSLGQIPGIRLPVERKGLSSSWHLYPIRLDLDLLNATRGEIFSALRAENIGVNVHYIPVTYHPYYRERFGYRGGEFPVAEGAYESLISLPMFCSMNDEDVEDVIDAVSKVISYFGPRQGRDVFWHSSG